MTTNKMNQPPEEMHKVFLNSDLKRWKEEIEIVNVELIFYKNLLNAHIKENTSWAKTNYESLFRGIDDMQYYNEMFHKNFLRFNNTLPGLTECEDIQCEAHFLNEHAQLKESIENHFSVYKEFKKTLFLYLKTRFNY